MSGVSSPAAYAWSAFAITDVHSDTGFPEAVINKVWEDSKAALPVFSDPRQKDWTCQHYFYALFMFLNFMPTVARFKALIRTKIGGTVSYSSFQKHAFPIAEAIAASVDYISWERRLALDNHHRLMPYFVTGIVDGFPVQVNTCKDKRGFRLLNQGKYKFNCLKGEMIISLTGEIISFTFPFIGVRNDAPVSNCILFPNHK